MGTQLKTREAIVNDKIDYTIANSDVLKDFNDGSNLITIYGANGRTEEDFYNRTIRVWQSDLKKNLLESFNFEKADPSKSNGFIEMFANLPVVSDIPIPKDTIINTDDGLQFITKAAGTIPTTGGGPGTVGSGLIPIESVDTGAIFNVEANTITTLPGVIPGVASINNASPTTNGDDGESNAEHTQRFQLELQGLGVTTVDGLRSQAVNADPQISSAKVIEDTSVFQVIIDDGTGFPSADLIALVQALLDDPKNKPVNKEAQAQAPSPVINPLINVQIEFSGTASKTEAELQIDVKTAMSTFINGLEVGEDMDYTALGKAVRDVVLDITSLRFQIDLGSGFDDCIDIPVSSTGVIRINESDINFT